MQGNGDVLDGLLYTLVGQVGLSQVVVGNHQSEVRLAVVEHKQLVEGQLLDFNVDCFLPARASGRHVQHVKLHYDLLCDLIFFVD